MTEGFLKDGFLESRFLMGGSESGINKYYYTLCQIIGFIGGRIVGGPWVFSVDVIEYAMGAVGWKILFYDKEDKTQKIGELSSDLGSGVVTALDFDWVKTGCGDFSLTLGVNPTSLSFTVENNQGVEIYLYHDSNPWYAGYITQKPKPGSTERPWTIKGVGYFNQLQTCMVDQDFTNEEVSDIVRDLMTGFVEEKTDIVYADYKILQRGYTVADIRFDYTTAKKAISQLRDLAQNFVFGVDEMRELFFNGTNPTVNPLAIFSVGKNIDKFKIEETTEDIINKIYVKAGLLSGSPKSNIQAIVNDYNSQVLYGLRETVKTAPSVRNADDAERWGTWQLDSLKRPQEKAKISWADCSGGLIKAEGKARIFDKDGNKHELPIEKAAYSVDSKGIGCALTLGKAEPSMGSILRNILFDIANEELLQQQNMSQL